MGAAHLTLSFRRGEFTPRVGKTKLAGKLTEPDQAVATRAGDHHGVLPDELVGHEIGIHHPASHPKMLGMGTCMHGADGHHKAQTVSIPSVQRTLERRLPHVAQAVRHGLWAFPPAQAGDGADDYQEDAFSLARLPRIYPIRIALPIRTQGFCCT